MDRIRDKQNNRASQRRKKQRGISGMIMVCLLILVILLLVTCVRHRKSPAVKVLVKTGGQICKVIKKESSKDISVTLRFAGDINFDDDYFPMQHFQEIGAESIRDVIDPEFVELMNKADLMWVNNEFCYTDSKEPLEGKAFTFSADPANVKYLKELGVDVAGLANNHVFDYGEQGLLDTLDTLKKAEIPYAGAGHDIKEAASPVYARAGSLTIAYVAAERAEKVQIVTREATENESGVLRCYDNERFIQSIKEAAEKADYVIALPHWGTEHSTVLEEVQTQGARAYIDAGADAVIGAHPHILQGIEYYQEKPIMYSLGNFWFDNYELQTVIAELHITRKAKDKGKMTVDLVLYPGIQSQEETHPANESEREEIFRHLESISPGDIRIDDEGVVSAGE